MLAGLGGGLAAIADEAGTVSVIRFSDGVTVRRIAYAAPLAAPPLILEAISNRGVRVWPQGDAPESPSDLWRCRFVGGDIASSLAMSFILAHIANEGVGVIGCEALISFDGVPGFVNT